MGQEEPRWVGAGRGSSRSRSCRPCAQLAYAHSPTPHPIPPPHPSTPAGMWVLMDYLFNQEAPSGDWYCQYVFYTSIVL